MNSTPIATGGIDVGTIILALLILVAIVAVSGGMILFSLWLTSKVNGSKGLVWGALLGVATVYFRPLIGLLLGRWGHFSFLYESLLPSAAASLMLLFGNDVVDLTRQRRLEMSNLTIDNLRCGQQI
jgi:hypothetical protein